MITARRRLLRPRRDWRPRWQLGQPVRRAVSRAAGLVWRDLRFGDLHRSGKEFELMGRAMGFAALAMLTMFPLLVVVAAAGAVTHHGLAVWVVYGMGLTGPAARAVVQLFSAPGKVLSTTSVVSLVLLAVFGVTFAGSIQAGFERIWGLTAGSWNMMWRQVVWLAVFVAYIYAAASVSVVTRNSPAATASQVAVAVVLGALFFWWGLPFLLGGRVSYLAALPGAVVTVVFLAGLRVFSALVFEPLIVTNALTYGALGTVLILQSWLIGVGWVVYGGQLLGCWFYNVWFRAWADSRWGHGEPGQGTGAVDGPASKRARRGWLESHRTVRDDGFDLAFPCGLTGADDGREADADEGEDAEHRQRPPELTRIACQGGPVGVECPVTR
jgi:membrane protein